jgi:ATP-dependent Lhr-like helicase
VGTLSYVEKPSSQTDVARVLTPTVKKWFKNKFPSFSLPQRYGVKLIHGRENLLVSAPTGSTKTLTAFLAILNELVDSAEKGILEDKVYAVYISPLKALNNDIAVNLLEPLKEMIKISEKASQVRVAVRTGDTTASEKAKMLKKPPHILITTPESLGIVLSSMKFRDHLHDVQWCIVDEVHALAENKRGVHLSLSLERLNRLATSMSRVGLSATVAPIEEIARFLVGKRDCKIVKVHFTKDLDLEVVCPVPNLIDASHRKLQTTMYKKIDSLIQKHRTTIIFTNTRAATERVVDHLKTTHPKKYVNNIGAHHGSMSKATRLKIENQLRKGELKACVSSTSLELGIDIGFVDLVICLGSPKSVARFLQRAGRAGHKLHQTIKAKIIVLDRDDLVECACLVRNAREGKIDRLHIPTMALDVLAQHVLGMALEQNWDENDMYKLIKKSYCYHDLKRSQFEQIADYLAGKFAPLQDRNIFARLWREKGRIGKSGGMSRVIYMTNIGTIPDQSHITVKIREDIVGTLDEAFVENLKQGDIFLLGGDPYEFRFSRGMVAQVKSAVSRMPTVPSWFSEMLPLSFDLATDIGQFRRFVFERMLHNKPQKEILKWIREYLEVDETTALALYSYLREQYDYCKVLGNDKLIIIEQNPQDGKTVFHSLFGRRVNDCLSRAIAFVLAQKDKRDVELGISDNGFYISGKRVKAKEAFKILRPDKLQKVMDLAIERSELYKRRFRHCAGRALMILRNYKGRQKRVGRQQVSSMILMKALERLDRDFCILQEAKRECLEDVMDIKNTMNVLQGVRDNKILVKEIHTNPPSPFAFSLALQGHLDVLKIEDKHEFLRRMHKLVLAKIGQEDHEFDYQNYWKEQEEEVVEEKLSAQDELRHDAMEVARKLRLPRMYADEFLRLIDGEEKFNNEFVGYLNELVEGTIPKAYPDRLIKFVMKKKAEVID